MEPKQSNKLSDKKDLLSLENNNFYQKGKTNLSSSGKKIDNFGSSRIKNSNNEYKNLAFKTNQFSSISNTVAPLKGIGGFLWGSNQKKAGLGLGIISVLIGGIISLSLVSGPLELVQISKLMDKFHFSSLRNAENSRLEKIAQFIYDPSRPERTRLGLVGNAIADNLESRIHEATGLKPLYEDGQFKGWIADSAEFDGYTSEEIKNAMAKQFNVDPSSIDTINVNGEDFHIYNPDSGGLNLISRYRSQMSTARELLSESGLNGISSYIGARVLKSRAGWSFHPIKALDSEYQAKLFSLLGSARDKAVEKLKQQFDTNEETALTNDVTVPPTEETGQAENSSGNTVSDTPKQEAAGAGSSIENTPSESNIHGKILGGGAVLIGVACVMNGIDKEIPKLRMIKVILPMMKFAGQYMSLGSQIQSGQNLDPIQVGFYSQLLNGKNSKGQPSSWSQAKSIEAELGQPQTGPDLPKSAQVFDGGVPFSFLNNIPLLNPVCSALGSPLGFIASTVIAPFQSFFQQFVIGPALNSIVKSIVGWLTGIPINVFSGAGATDGNYINYGSMLSANEQFASAGGVPLSQSQSSVIADANQSLSNTVFKSKSLAYRLFNPYNPNTLAAKLVDNFGSSNATQNVATVFSEFGSIFSSTLRNLSDVFTGLSNASAQQPAYNYNGLKAVGFTAAQLSDPKYNDPFKIGCIVVGGPGCPASDGNGILGSASNPNSPFNVTYKNRIYICFGDTVTFNSTEGKYGAWDINFTNSGPIDMYGGPSENTPYQQQNCSSKNPDWMYIRFWLLDTETIEGYDCYAGNNAIAYQSCLDVGYSSGSSSGSLSTNNNSVASASINIKDINNNSSKISCASSTNNLGIYSGYVNGVSVPIRLCAVPNLPSSSPEANNGYGVSGSNGSCPLNSRVAGVVYNMVQAAKKAGVQLSASSCFVSMSHQESLYASSSQAEKPGFSNLQMGLGIEFNVPSCENNISGVCSDPNNSMWNWLYNNAASFGYGPGSLTNASYWSPSGV
jgi:hypothetical protein